MARAMEIVGDRWSILILREAYYGVKRFDEFEYYVGVAPNILSSRLKKLVDAGIMTRVRLPEHAGRFEYVLTEKGRDFFPAYLALKKWGDAWLAEPAGPQVVFRERGAARPIDVPELRTSSGKPLRLEDVGCDEGACFTEKAQVELASSRPRADSRDTPLRRTGPRGMRCPD